MPITNPDGGDRPSGTPSDRLDRIEALLEQLAQQSVQTDARINSNAKAIEALTSDVVRDRRRTDAQIAQLTRDVSALTAHQATMFEIIQGFNEDRVTLAENMASIAQSLSRLAGEQQP
ncbi:MAG: hypothetical protein ACFB4I_14195 [Cyanophyceae cyanobacterium]